MAFVWAVAFARWLTFKISSFLEYFVFFQAVFSSQNNSNVRVDCFVAFLMFDPN